MAKCSRLRERGETRDERGTDSRVTVVIGEEGAGMQSDGTGRRRLGLRRVRTVLKVLDAESGVGLRLALLVRDGVVDGRGTGESGGVERDEASRVPGVEQGIQVRRRRLLRVGFARPRPLSRVHSPGGVSLCQSLATAGMSQCWRW